MSRVAKLFYGASWGGASVAVTALFQLAFMAILARLLEPADFGLVAVANIALRFLSYFAQLGVGPAIVQKSALEKGDVGAAICLSGLVSLGCALLSIALAPVVETFFEMPGLRGIVSGLAANFVLVGVCATPVSLLRRALRFKAVAFIETVSYVIGYGAVGIGAALLGLGVWSLVAASISQAALNLIMCAVATRRQIELVHAAHQRKHFISFGARYSIVGFLEFLSANLDAIVIGKFFGQSTAGVYSRAVLLSNLPVQQPVNALTRALFPIMSGVSKRVGAVGVCFELSVLFVGVYAFACSLSISAAAPDVVECLLGAKWADVTPLLQVLSLSVGPIFVSHVAGVTLDSLGRISEKLKVQWTTLTLLAIGVCTALPYGPIAIAKALVATEWLRMFIAVAVVSRCTATSGRRWVGTGGLIVFLSVMPSAAVLAAASLLDSTVPALLRVSAEALTGAAVFALTAVFTRNWHARLESIQALVHHVPRLRRLWGVRV